MAGNHTPEIIKTEQVANGIVRFVARCCGDPSTDSVLTIHVRHDSTEEEVEADIKLTLDRVSKEHAAVAHVHRILAKYAGDKK